MFKFDENSTLPQLSAEIYRLTELFFHKLEAETEKRQRDWGDFGKELKEALLHLHELPLDLADSYLNDRYEGNEGHLMYRWILTEPKGVLVEHLKHLLEHDLFFDESIKDSALSWLAKHATPPKKE